jgi:hypothetical protein
MHPYQALEPCTGKGLNGIIAGLMSQKFTDAQHHYRTYEHETIAILQVLLKWEDKLMGYHIHVVSDHESLKCMQMQCHLSSQQV